MEKIMIIDGNSMLYRGFYAMPLLTSPDGEFTNAVYSFSNMLIKAVETYKPNYIVVAFDHAKKTFRNDLYPEYKATRSETPEELKPQFPLMKELLKKMRICVLEQEGIEADDIIATVSARFKDLQKIIITGDRDSFQLVDDNTNIYFTKKGLSDIQIINLQTLKELYGITPSQVVDIKSLMGDKSDNIPGVKGIGDKTAHELIANFGTLENVYNHLEELKPKVKNCLETEKDMAFLSYKLALNVVDDKLNCKLDDCTFEFPFKQEVKDTFKKLGFKTLLKKESLFCEEKKELTNIKRELITTKEQLVSLIEKIEKQKEFSIYYDDKTIFVGTENMSAQIDVDFSFFESDFKLETLVEKFKKLFEDESIQKIVFNFKSMLYKFAEFNIAFKNVFDVSIAKYLLESTIKNYTIDDLCEEFIPKEIALSLYNAKKQFASDMDKNNLLKLFNEIEMPLCKVLYDMEMAGIKIDLEVLKQCDEKILKEISEIETLIYNLVGHEFNIKSTQQVAKVLFEELGIKQPENTPKNSTSVEVLAEIVNEHKVVPLIIRYRRATKLKSTYIDNYYKFEKGGYIHSEFNQTNTDTGRLSSANPNLQNIPVRDSDSKFIREVFVSRFDDGVIASFDYDQIELKLMAHLSNDERMIQAFNQGKDVHRITASMIYNVPEEEVTKEQRSSAKAVNFGMMYGQGPYGLSQQLGCSVKQASSFMDLYFSKFPSIKEFVTVSIKKALENDNTAVTMFGRRRKITELSVKNAHLRQFGERVAVNMPLQGSASDIIKIAMIQVSEMMQKEKFESKLILQIHDELVFDVKKVELEKLSEKVKDIMQNVTKLQVPLTVSVNVGENLLK